MASPRGFLDTNILIYAFSTDARSAAAEELLQKGCVVSVQGLNEFANVARRKLLMRWDEIEEATGLIRALCHAVLPMDMDTHSTAMRLAARYDLSVFDALMLASAIRFDCRTFWSEDLQHGMLVDQKLRIASPFLGP